MIRLQTRAVRAHVGAPCARTHAPLVTALVLAAALLGCGEEAPREAASPLDDERAELALETAPAPEVRFASVSASGTGCPAGSYDTRIASDGKVFTTTFSSYETIVDPKTAQRVKECVLAMTLRSGEPTEFAVTSIFYSGYAFLEAGVRAQHTVRYGFHGSSADAGRSRSELTGPYDDVFLLQDELGRDRQNWSSCALEHVLNASTQLRVQNGTPRASGYANMSATDGSLKLVVRVQSRACKGTKSPRK